MYGVRAVTRTYGLHHGQSSRKVTVAFATLLHMLQVSYKLQRYMYLYMYMYTVCIVYTVNNVIIETH